MAKKLTIETKQYTEKYKTHLQSNYGIFWSGDSGECSRRNQYAALVYDTY